MTKRRLRKLVAIAITTTTIATTAPANAQVAVLDNSVLLKMTDTLSTVKSQLGQLQQIFGTVQKMQQAVGQFGPGSILGILQSLTGINLGQFKNVLNGIAPQLKTTGFASALQGNSSFTSALSSLQNAYSNSGNGIGSTKSTLMSALYAPAGSSVRPSRPPSNARRKRRKRSGLSIRLRRTCATRPSGMPSVGSLSVIRTSSPPATVQESLNATNAVNLGSGTIHIDGETSWRA